MAANRCWCAKTVYSRQPELCKAGRAARQQGTTPAPPCAGIRHGMAGAHQAARRIRNDHVGHSVGGQAEEGGHAWRGQQRAAGRQERLG